MTNPAHHHSKPRWLHTVLAALFLLLASFAVPAAANALGIQDPSFEQTVPGLVIGSYTQGYVFDPQGLPWVFSGPSAGITSYGTGFIDTDSPSGIPNGNQEAFIGHTSTISQTFTMGASGVTLPNGQPDQMYVLQFAGGPVLGNANYGESFQVLFDGTPIGPTGGYTPLWTPTIPGYLGYTAYMTSPFTAAPGQHTIQFAGIGNGYAMIDNVSMMLASQLGMNVTTDWITTPYLNIPNFASNPACTNNVTPIVSIASGNWSNPSTWSGGQVPGAGAIVEIAAGTTVTYDVNTTVTGPSPGPETPASQALNTVQVQNGGTLTFSTTQNTNMFVVNMMVLQGGTLNIGTQANPIPANIKAGIVWADQALNLTCDPEQYGNGLIVFGTFNSDGVEKTPYVALAAEPHGAQSQPSHIGDTALVLASTTVPTGWAVGDSIELPDSRQMNAGSLNTNPVTGSQLDFETATIEGFGTTPCTISGQAATCSTVTVGNVKVNGQTATYNAIQFDHPGAHGYDYNGTNATVRHFPHVLNTTRNVSIHSQNSNGVDSTGRSTRGYALFTAHANVSAKYTTFGGQGRTGDWTFNNEINNSLPLNFSDDTTFNGNGNVTNSTVAHLGTNQGNRNAITILDLFGQSTPQNNGDTLPNGNGPQFTFKGNVVMCPVTPMPFIWGINVVNSYYGLIQDNDVVNWYGSGVRVDYLSSYNDFDRNFVTRITGNGTRSSTDQGFGGNGFWFGNANDYITNNFVSNLFTGINVMPVGTGSTISYVAQGNGSIGTYGYGYQLYAIGGAGETGVGNVNIPAYQGADPSLPEQSTQVNMNAIPILSFAHNTAYGVMSRGLSYWWINYNGSPEPPTTNGGTIDHFDAWNVGTGSFGYQCGYVTIESPEVIGDPAQTANGTGGTGWEFDDYNALYAVFNNLDMENLKIGMGAPEGTSGTPFHMNNPYFAGNAVAMAPLAALWSVSYGGCGLGPNYTYISNPTFVGNTINMETAWYAQFQLNGPGMDFIGLQQAFVTNYNDNGTNRNCQIYYPEQAPNYIVPQATWDAQQGSFSNCSVPVAGLTNAQAWAQYGEAIGGAVAPANATPCPAGIVGSLPDGSTVPALCVCTTSTSVINPPTGVSITASATTVAAGTAVTFTANVTGGTAPFTYTWDISDGSPSANGASISHTFTTPNPMYGYWVTLNVSNSAGEASAITNILVTSGSVAPSGVTITGVPSSCGVPCSFTAGAQVAGGTGPFTYSWKLDGTVVSSSATPTISTSAPGSHSLVVNVANSVGSANSNPVSFTVTSGTTQPPTASFTDTVSGAGVSFDGTGSHDPNGGGSIVSYAWAFGDGATGSGVTPSHTYAASGSYNVTLTVTDSEGGTGSVSHNVTVTVSNQPPVASFTNTVSNFTASFNGSGSHDPNSGGSITGYSWNFGESTSSSNTSTLENPSHVYATAGTYTVTLTVTDSEGGTASVQHAITVGGSNVVAVITDTVVNLMSAAEFNGSGSSTANAGATITSYAWNFGAPNSPNNTSTLENPSHVYATGGTYTVTLTVTDSTGQTGTASTSVTITPALVTPTSGAAPLTVNASSPSVSGATAYVWHWGDGATSPGQDATHTYTAAGTYNVTLSVTTPGVTTTLPVATVTVAGAPALVITSQASITAGVAATFTATETNTNAAVSWNFGDPSSGASNSATGLSVSHSFTAAGTYTVTAMAGTVTSNILTVTVAAAPAVNISCPANGTTGNAVTCTGNTNTSAPISWNFGDGLPTVTGATVSHTYTTPGMYTVTATAGSATASTIITETNSPLVISLTSSSTGGPAPLPVIIEVFAITGGTGPYTYSWNCDGGTSSGGNGPDHVCTYFTNGTYPDSVTVTDSLGHTGTANITITASASAATASFSATVVPYTKQVNFASTSTNSNPTTTSYSWDFGDGTTGSGVTTSHTFLATGGHEVKLTVNDGIISTVNESVYIPALPILTISGPANAVAGTMQEFTSTETGASATPSWTSGDGGTGSGTTFIHTFTAAGTYTVAATAANGAILSNNLTVTVTPALVPLSASYIGSATGLTAHFDGSGSRDPNNGGTITSYHWAFGDGTTANGVTATHAYAAPGNYNVTLTVTDNLGATGSNTLLITIAALPPVASFTSSVANLAVSVNGSGSSDPNGGSITSYAWNWGDGSTGSGANPSHAYATAGTRTITLTVTDNYGVTNTTSHSVTTTAPVVAPSDVTVAGSPTTSGTNPLAVSFTIDNTDGTAPFTYLWSFGDGGTSTSQNPSHTYTAAGTFTASVVVSNPAGNATSNGVPITVTTPTVKRSSGSPSPSSSTTSTTNSKGDVVPTKDAQKAPNPLAVNPVATPDSGTAPLSVTFNANATAANGKIVSYSWDFGDKSTSAKPSPIHTYANAGEYTTRLTVTDNNKNTATGSVKVTATTSKTPHQQPPGSPGM